MSQYRPDDHLLAFLEALLLRGQIDRSHPVSVACRSSIRHETIRVQHFNPLSGRSPICVSRLSWTLSCAHGRPWQRFRLSVPQLRVLDVERSSERSYEICPVCFWEDDPVQNEDPEYQGGANSVSLTTARRNYVAHGACDQEFVGNVRAPKVEEIPSFRSWTQDPEKQAALERGIRSALLETARAMLSGKLGVIDGCSAIACLASGMEDDRLRPTLQTFEIVAGETEELPRGDVGDLWHPAALAAKDVEVAAYEAQVTNEVFNACRSLEALLVLDPPPRTKPNSQPELSG